jgi:hypothetical protein
MKANYKVFDKKTGKYISPGYKSKSTWTSPSWAIEAARTHANQQVSSYPYNKAQKSLIENYVIKNLELHILPLQDAIKVPMAEAIDQHIKEKEEKKAKEAEKQEAYRKQREIKELEIKIAEYTSQLNKLKNDK